MSERLKVDVVAPEGYRAVMEMERHVRSRVDPVILGLVKMRASILNECAFCVDLHSREWISKQGSPRRLAAIAAWRDAPLFTERERAALALTDAVTRLSGGVTDEVWDTAAKFFPEPELADLLLAITVINTWNRIAIATRKALPEL